MLLEECAKERLNSMLRVAGLPVRASYCTSEVCKILGISDRTFWRLLHNYERNERGQLRRPDCLDSFTLGTNRRVPYNELVAFLVRNNTYQRQFAADPAQMALFD